MTNKFRPVYRPLTDAEAVTLDEIKARADHLDRVIDTLPPSREKSLAMTNLEQAVMWAVKALTS